jgi:hypothetical protein
MSHIKTLKTTPTCFDHQLIITRELICSQLKTLSLKFDSSYVVNVVMRQQTCICFTCCLVCRGVQTLLFKLMFYYIKVHCVGPLYIGKANWIRHICVETVF